MKKGHTVWFWVSILLWLLSFVICFYVIGRMENKEESLNDVIYDNNFRVRCSLNSTFGGTFHENLRKLEQNVFHNSQKWLQHLGFDRRVKRVMMSFPVIVTGANSAFFIKSQGLVKSIHEKVMSRYKAVKFIFYNLGLLPSEVEKLRKFCRCQVRDFPFDQVPDHVRKLQLYAFKPIIVNLLYQEFGHVWWLDASMRFVSSDLKLPVKYLHENNILFFTYDVTNNIALHTDTRMFSYFSESPCPYKYFGEIEAGNVAFRKGHVAEVVLCQWVSCALDINCISPLNSTTNCGRGRISNMTDDLIGRCHRYDQSALSIILRRLYHKQNDYPIVSVPFRITETKRRQSAPFFV